MAQIEGEVLTVSALHEEVLLLPRPGGHTVSSMHSGVAPRPPLSLVVTHTVSFSAKL